MLAGLVVMHQRAAGCFMHRAVPPVDAELHSQLPCRAACPLSCDTAHRMLTSLRVPCWQTVQVPCARAAWAVSRGSTALLRHDCTPEQST